MSNRTAAIAFAAITGCVSTFGITSASANPASAAAGTAASAASGSAANAADECLASPKATTPAGAHWYYRVEKGTKRKCWYLGEAGAKTKKTVEVFFTAFHFLFCNHLFIILPQIPLNSK